MPYKNAEDKARWYRNKRIKNLMFVMDHKKARGCVDCGEDDPVILEYHHRVPAKKKKDINRMSSQHYSREELLEEMDKCDVICANCHRRRHYAERYSHK